MQRINLHSKAYEKPAYNLPHGTKSRKHKERVFKEFWRGCIAEGGFFTGKLMWHWPVCCSSHSDDVINFSAVYLTAVIQCFSVGQTTLKNCLLLWTPIYYLVPLAHQSTLNLASRLVQTMQLPSVAIGHIWLYFINKLKNKNGDAQKQWSRDCPESYQTNNQAHKIQFNFSTISHYQPSDKYCDT